MFEDGSFDEGSDEELHSADVFPLIKRVFGEYTEEHDLDTEQLERVSIFDFAEWLVEWVDRTNGVEFCAEHELDFEAWEVLREMCNHPLGLLPLAGRWPDFALASRPMPKNSVGALQVNVILRFRDGRLAVLNNYGPEEFYPGFSDPVLMRAVKDSCSDVLRVLEAKGIDGIYGAQSFDLSTPEHWETFREVLASVPEIHGKMAEYIRKVRKERGITDTSLPPRAEKDKFDFLLPSPSSRSKTRPLRGRDNNVEGGF